MWSQIRLKELLKGGESRKQGLIPSFVGNRLVLLLLTAIRLGTLGKTSYCLPPSRFHPYVSSIIVNREQSKKKRAYPEVLFCQLKTKECRLSAINNALFIVR